MTRTMTIHKRNALGEEVIAYPAVVLERGAGRVIVEAHFNLDGRDVGGMWLARGDRFVETYYADRWYNVFAIYDGEKGRFKGWYANITRPAQIEAADLYADDLALDMLVFPEGRLRVLDEDEFEALALSEGERGEALAALEQLKRLAENHQAPFSVQDVEPPARGQPSVD